jgi:Family of unknown function (DUF6166)
MKVYVGVRRKRGRRVFVMMAGSGAEGDYRLCHNGEGDNPVRLAFAILADHLGDRERALALRGQFERALRGRFDAGFWTITENELGELLARLGPGR